MIKKRFLWVTDSWETLDHPRDTTLRLAQEALLLGHESHWCSYRSIRIEGGKCLLDARRIRQVGPSREPGDFQFVETRSASPAEFDSIHYRVDPPVDLSYLQPLQLLVTGLAASRRSGRRRAELVNPADVLFLGNEKLEPALLGALMPPMVVSSRWDDLARFGSEHGRTVLKPLHQAQSKGVELIDWGSPDRMMQMHEARVKLESATEHFTRPILLQKFLDGIQTRGETRLWFLDGKLLAAIQKHPLENDFRVNVDRGSRLAPARLNRREKVAALRIGKHLRTRKIRLAAVDLIDGQITDFNFTSPGLIVQMEAITGKNLARAIISALARKR